MLSGRGWAGTVGLALAWLWAGAVQADPIAQIRSLTGAHESVAFTPFDPSEGVLERVVVEIHGTLTQLVDSPAHPLGSDHAIVVTTEQLLFGLAGQGFTFASPVELQLAGTASGAGGLVSLVQQVRYHFEFTEATDLAGFTTATPVLGDYFGLPTSIDGTRADFEQDASSLGVLVDMLVRPGQVLASGAPIALLEPSFAGTISVVYVVSDAVPPPVPPGDAVFHTTVGNTTLFFHLDPATGVIAPIGLPSFGRPLVGSPLVDRRGNLFFAHENNTFGADIAAVKRGDALDPSITRVVEFGGLSGNLGIFLPRDLLQLPGGDLVLCEQGPGPNNSIDGKLVRIDPDVGSFSVLGEGVLVNPSRIALAPDGDEIFLADVRILGIFQFEGVLQSFDLATGVVTTRFQGAPLVAATDLAALPDGRLLWLDSVPTRLYRIDVSVNPAVVELVGDQLGAGIGISLDEAGRVLVTRLLAPDAPAELIEIDVDAFDPGDPTANQSLAHVLLVGARAPTFVPRTACTNGLDDDGDGTVDELDAGCGGPFETDETDDCDNGVDDDNDGEVDGADSGCSSPLDPSERPACSDGLDLDRDGDADDPQDRGCLNAESPDEDPPCDDKVDNDGDGFVDFAEDDACLGEHGPSEVEADCGNAVDDDSDGLVDYPDDPGCRTATSPIEDPECDDGADNERDGFTDFPDDTGCEADWGVFEEASCTDGLDNDGDGAIDAADSDCSYPGYEDGGAAEEASGHLAALCGLGGEVVLVMLALRRLARRSSGR